MSSVDLLYAGANLQKVAGLSPSEPVTPQAVPRIAPVAETTSSGANGAQADTRDSRSGFQQGQQAALAGSQFQSSGYLVQARQRLTAMTGLVLARNDSRGAGEIARVSNEIDAAVRDYIRSSRRDAGSLTATIESLLSQAEGVLRGGGGREVGEVRVAAERSEESDSDPDFEEQERSADFGPVIQDRDEDNAQEQESLAALVDAQRASARAEEQLSRAESVLVNLTA